jgi:hypothetical protein
MPGISGVAVTAKEVFWTNFGGSVMRAPIAGGASSVVDIGTGATGITVDANNVYWLNGYADGPGTAYQMPLSGGSKMALAPAYGGKRIVVDAKNVYWTEGEQVSQEPIGIAVTTLPPSAGNGEPYGVALANGNIYWSNSFNGDVNSSPIHQPTAPPPTPTRIASGTGAGMVATDGVVVFFVDNLGIHVVSAGGGSATQIVSARSEGGNIEDIAVDEVNLYWTSTFGTVRQMAR